MHRFRMEPSGLCSRCRLPESDRFHAPGPNVHWYGPSFGWLAESYNDLPLPAADGDTIWVRDGEHFRQAHYNAHIQAWMIVVPAHPDCDCCDHTQFQVVRKAEEAPL
jgi:hypothetical protein